MVIRRIQPYIFTTPFLLFHIIYQGESITLAKNQNKCWPMRRSSVCQRERATWLTLALIFIWISYKPKTRGRKKKKNPQPHHSAASATASAALRSGTTHNCLSDSNMLTSSVNPHNICMRIFGLLLIIWWFSMNCYWNFASRFWILLITISLHLISVQNFKSIYFCCCYGNSNTAHNK